MHGKLILVISLSVMMILAACGKKESKTTEIKKTEDPINQSNRNWKRGNSN